MNEDDRRMIYNTQNQKTTEELVEIWQTNDRVEWVDETFEIIEQILLDRLGELPPQNEAVLEHVEIKEDHGSEEDAIIGKHVAPDQAPAYYQPRQVLRLVKWINQAAIISLIAIFIVQLYSLPNNHEVFLSYFKFKQSQFMGFLAWFLAFGVYFIATGLTAGLTFFALKSLGWVLKILMEMEFRSRGLNLQQSLATEVLEKEPGRAEGEG